MKWVLVFLLSVHGLIHLLGFVKEFNLATVSGFSGQTIIPLTRPMASLAGVLWVAVCATFLTTAVVFFLQKQWWWVPGFMAVLLSQALIILYWKDAKWGTIANVIVLLPLLVSAAEWTFVKGVNGEIDHLLSEPISKKVMVTEEKMAHLPLPVQKWLHNSGAVEKEVAQTVRLKQKGLMRLKPDSDNWVEASAEQYFRWDKPAFIWKVKMHMMPLVPVVGRDRLIDGKGAMQIKALSLVNIVNQSNLPKLNQSGMQRLLAEICWTPSAALSPLIQWEAVNDTTAKATMRFDGVSGTVSFRFNKEGEVIACTADRYKDSNDAAQLEKWEVVNTRYGVLGGIRMPVESAATWKLKDGDFTWYKLVITEIEYNNPQRYTND